MLEKRAILVVSFGTSHQETRRKTIAAIESQIAKTYPEWEIRRAFTSGMIMRKLKERDKLYIDNVAEAMKRLSDDGFTRIFVQPTHIINGDEYDKMVSQVELHRKDFSEVRIGKPLLSSTADYEAVCRGIMKWFPDIAEDKKEALVLMGHGTGHFADAAYAALDYRFKALGYDNVFVGTVEGYPELADVNAMVDRYRPDKVTLLPFMVVAGDHAVNDMAGEEADSWKSVFAAGGYPVDCVLVGLGEMEPIRRIYLEHIADGLADE
jgi:sirohydrochlorin cobaltochelatase